MPKINGTFLDLNQTRFMKTSNFKDLTHQQKILILQEKGSFLTTRTIENYYIKLYLVDNFYVEIWSSSHLPWQDVVKINVLEDYKRLTPYLPTLYSKQLFTTT